MLRKRLGQHFLKSNFYIEKIINSFDVLPPTNILEIGSGKGNITFPLIERGYNIIAIEKDKRFEKYFRDKNVKIFYEDALSFPKDIGEFLKEHKISIIFSNLPYSSGTKIFLRYLPYLFFVSQMVLMFQKEVGEKILSNGSLFVITNLIAEVKTISKVPPDAFSPKPKVESILLSFKSKGNYNFSFEDFLKFLAICFKHPRKTLYNNLMNYFDGNIIKNMFEDNILLLRPHQLKPEILLEIFEKIGSVEK